MQPTRSITERADKRSLRNNRRWVPRFSSVSVFMLVIVAIVVDRTVVKPTLENKLAVADNIIVVVICWRGVCMPLLMLVEWIYVNAIFNKSSANVRPVCVFLEEPCFFVCEVFDEVGRLRLAKNFGFSLSVEIQYKLYETWKRRSKLWIDWLNHDVMRVRCAVKILCQSEFWFVHSAEKEERISRLSSPEKFLHFPPYENRVPRSWYKIRIFWDPNSESTL